MAAAAAPAAPMDAAKMTAVAQAFVRHYYTIFDSDRSKLVSLYQKTSKMSFEGQTFQGAETIVAKLGALQFKQVAHAIKSLDVQPSGCGGLIVFCTGDMKVNNAQTMKFSQAFHLMPTPGNASAFWVHNDVFRLG